MSSPSLFIDTGAFFARYVTSDQYHHQAMQLWNKVREEKYKCITTNAVTIEFINLLLRKAKPSESLQIAKEIYHSHLLKVEPLTSEQELSALDWLQRFGDQRFSMTDATSFAFMEEHKITNAFTFDHHFEIAGFKKFTLSVSK